MSPAAAPGSTAGPSPGSGFATSGRRWIVLEPWYGGSHRHLVDGLAARLPSAGIALDLWTLPPRRWKWRMRGAAVELAGRWATRVAEADDRLRGVAGIFTSSLLDAAALRGLLPRAARVLPLVVYFHENQLAYPVRVDDRRDDHFAWTNAQSALAADRVLWNSGYNRNSFLDGLARLVARMPDARPEGMVEAIRRRSAVLPVPFDAAGLARAAEAATAPDAPDDPERPCRILWNHRWEHDKDPEAFFDAVLALAEEGLPIELAVLGEAFAERPPVFERARRRLDELGVPSTSWGYVPERAGYAAALAGADVAVSTARHEFQGLAVLEAAACGAVPLVPDDLAYREIWPKSLRYRRGALTEALRDRIVRRAEWRAFDPRPFARAFDWSALLPRWLDVFNPRGS